MTAKYPTYFLLIMPWIGKKTILTNWKSRKGSGVSYFITQPRIGVGVGVVCVLWIGLCDYDWGLSCYHPSHCGLWGLSHGEAGAWGVWLQQGLGVWSAGSAVLAPLGLLPCYFASLLWGAASSWWGGGVSVLVIDTVADLHILTLHTDLHTFILTTINTHRIHIHSYRYALHTQKY